MTQRTNEYGQPIGELLSHWSPRPAPTGVTLKGQFCQLEPLNAARHAADLFAAYQTAPDGRNWTYLFSGPFANELKARMEWQRLTFKDRCGATERYAICAEPELKQK